MTAATKTDHVQTYDFSAIEAVASFLPPVLRKAMLEVATLLMKVNIDISAMLKQIFDLGEAYIDQGLDGIVGQAERFVDAFYTSKILEKLEGIHPALKNGAEMTLQMILEVLKSLEPKDVATMTAVLALVALMPELATLNAPDLSMMVIDVVLKYWNIA